MTDFMEQDLGGLGEQELLEAAEAWGYRMLPKRHLHSPGFGGVLIAVREGGEESFFSPASVRLRMCDAQCNATWMVLHVHTPIESGMRVCAGPLEVSAHKGDRVRFFTFGGTVEVMQDHHKTIYKLVSPAPVLEAIVRDGTEMTDLLVAESEALLAREEAKWGNDEHGYLARLGSVDPLALYAATVQELHAHCESSPDLRQALGRLCHVLEHELTWLRHEKRVPVEPIDDLLGPAA